MDTSNHTNEQGQIACRLLGREFMQRKEKISNDLLRHAVAIDELPDGFAFRFDGYEPWAQRVMEFIAVERVCCPFFRFELIVQPNDGAIELRLVGTEEVKAFVLAELGIAN